MLLAMPSEISVIHEIFFGAFFVLSMGRESSMEDRTYFTKYKGEG